MLKKFIDLLCWIAVVLVVFLAVRAVARWVLSLFAAKADRKDLNVAQAKTDEKFHQLNARLDQLTADTKNTVKALREENHQIARAIVDEVRVKTALPAKTKPKGPAGFGQVEPEAI
jgi:F0F1-type ATP synthase membrane subunit b/b'